MVDAQEPPQQTTTGDRSLSSPLSRAAAGDVRIVAKSGAVQMTGLATQRVLQLLFAMVAVRILTTSGYGLYRQVAQVLGFAAQLGLAGFNFGAMRFITRARAAADHGAVRGAVRVAVAGTLVSSAIVVAFLVVGADRLASAFADAGGRSELAELIRLGAAYVPLWALMQVLRFSTQAYKTVVPSVIVGSIIQPAARFVLGVALLVAGFGVAGSVSSLVISVGVAALAGAWYVRRILTPDEKAATPIPRPREMVRFTLPQAGASLLGTQAGGVAVIVLGVLSSDKAVGLFAIAVALNGPGQLFLTAIVNIWAPLVSDLYERGELERLGSLFQTITRWVVTFSFPIFALLIVEPEVFVRLFGGDTAAEAARIVPILAAGNLFYVATGPVGYVISMTGRPGVNFANSVVAVGLYAALGVLVVPRYGVVGMAVVDAVVTALVNTVRVIECYVLVGVHPFGRTFFKPVTATLAGVAALLAWRLVPGAGTLQDIAGIAIAALVLLLVLRALGLDPEERHVWERIRARAFKGRARRQ